MAFQSGTQVRPELGRMDFSGYARAGELYGQAFQQLGQQISGAIQQNRQKKKEKEEAEARVQAAMGMAEQLGISDFTEDDAKQLEKSKLLLPALEMYGQRASQDASQQAAAQAASRDREIVNKALGAATEAGTGKIDTAGAVANYTQLGGANPDQFLKIAEGIREGQETPKSTLQSPSTYVLPDQTKALGSFDPGTGKVINLDTGKPLPGGSVKQQASLYADKPLSAKVQEKLVLGEAETVKEWLSGGSFQARKQAGNLETAIDLLESGEADTGNFLEFVPDIGGVRKSARALVNPKGQEAYDNVVAVVATTLKAALGGSFTEKEGQRILDASYNPQLSPEQNVARLKPILAATQATIRQKDEMAIAMRGGTYDPATFKTPAQVWDEEMGRIEGVDYKAENKGLPPTPDDQLDLLRQARQF